MWTPAENSKATMDPYKTLFIARIVLLIFFIFIFSNFKNTQKTALERYFTFFQNYETSESKLRREFEKFGKIAKLQMVHDKNHKPKGYAFIEFSHKTEMSGMRVA